jgi:hypothetical protein
VVRENENHHKAVYLLKVFLTLTYLLLLVPSGGGEFGPAWHQVRRCVCASRDYYRERRVLTSLSLLIIYRLLSKKTETRPTKISLRSRSTSFPRICANQRHWRSEEVPT